MQNCSTPSSCSYAVVAHVSGKEELSEGFCRTIEHKHTLHHHRSRHGGGRSPQLGIPSCQASQFSWHACEPGRISWKHIEALPAPSLFLWPYTLPCDGVKGSCWLGTGPCRQKQLAWSSCQNQCWGLQGATGWVRKGKSLSVEQASRPQTSPRPPGTSLAPPLVWARVPWWSHSPRAVLACRWYFCLWPLQYCHSSQAQGRRSSSENRTLAGKLGPHHLSLPRKHPRTNFQFWPSPFHYLYLISASL